VGSFLSPGSEFRPVSLLEPLLLDHHNWPKIEPILTQGSDWPLLPNSDEEQISKNNEFITRGNHMPAIKYEAELLIMVHLEVTQGCMIPFPLHYINDLQNGELAPVGVDDKVWAEQENGSKKTKFWLTHDQSFEATVGLSVNRGTEKKKLHPLFYGGCLSRLVHYILSLRFHCPTVPILGGNQNSKRLTIELIYMGTQWQNVRSSTTNLPYLASASHLVVHLVPIYFWRSAQIWPMTSCTALIGTRHQPFLHMLTKSQIQSFFLPVWISNKLKVWMLTSL
jgi:hypothetical protein